MLKITDTQTQEVYLLSFIKYKITQEILDGVRMYSLVGQVLGPVIPHRLNFKTEISFAQAISYIDSHASNAGDRVRFFCDVENIPSKSSIMPGRAIQLSGEEKVFNNVEVTFL